MREKQTFTQNKPHKCANNDQRYKHWAFIRKIIQKALTAFNAIVYKTREVIRPGR